MNQNDKDEEGKDYIPLEPCKYNMFLSDTEESENPIVVFLGCILFGLILGYLMSL